MKNLFLYNSEKPDYNFEIEPNRKEIQNELSLQKVSVNLNVNTDYIKVLFSYPKNGDIIFRNFSVDINGESRKMLIIMADGLCDGGSVNEFILKPLMHMKHNEISSDASLYELITNTIMPQGQVTACDDLKNAALKINIGNAVLFADGMDKAIIIDVKSWEHRGVDSPENEAVIQGPHEGFNEVFRCNTALIRKTLNTPNLVMENVFLGKTSQTPGAVCYLKNVANKSLVDEVKKRVCNIDAEYILSSLDVEQYIEEESFLPVPQMVTTERPDRVCHALAKGRVAVVMNGSCHVLIMPTTFFDLITSAEDEYLRYPYSLLIRLLRYISVSLALLFPAVFVSILNFHPELLLTNIMLAISSSRAVVPFGAVVELLLMELAFEIIKEAGIRVPGPIGSTLGIVGGLIVGQAAVEANVVSPIMIIIVAVTGIASFTIPSYSLSFAFRFSRFLYIFGAAMAGLVGVIVVFFVNSLAAVSARSFGVPFLSPLTPSFKRESNDLLFGSPIWIRGTKRESFLKPKDSIKKGVISRKWLRRK